MAVRLLFVGDIHLGRRPTGLPAALAEAHVDPRALTPAETWRETVRFACRLPVDAVILAGDVVDSTEDRFEARWQFEQGVRELAEHGIRVLGVAGNHDVEALPRLAREQSAFELLGAGGRWELKPLVGRADGTPVRLLGWSFPTERHPESPLREPPRLDAGEGVVLGVLHCDLDAAASPHAPVRRRELEAVAVAGWFLGHIHKPDHAGLSIAPDPREAAGGGTGRGARPTRRPLGYLGSLTGLDPGPGERGAHGP